MGDIIITKHFPFHILVLTMDFLVAQMVKHLSTMRETWVQSLGWEGLLEKEIAIHSSILAWKIPRKEEPGRLQSVGSQRVWGTYLFMVAKVLRAHIYKSENRKRIGQQLSFIMASSNIYPHIWGGWYSQVALVVKNLPVNAGHKETRVWSLGGKRSPGRGHGDLLEYSCLENPKDRGAWRATVHRAAKCWTQLKWLNMHTLKFFIF